MLITSFILAVTGWHTSILMLKLMTLDRQLILVGSVALTLIGVYMLQNAAFDVLLLILFGTIGYYMRRYGYPVAGACVGLILGNGLESNLRRGLLLVDGS